MYSIGVDFGTASCRAVLYNCKTGKIDKISKYEYKNHRVEKLKTKELQVLQDPQEYLTGLIQVIRELQSGKMVEKNAIQAIGIDFTSCTCLPVNDKLQSLSQIEIYQNEPNAYAKLWKSHSAQNEANQINAVLKDESILTRYGGTISSEWLLPKLLEVKHDAPLLYDDMVYYMEAGDWLVSLLTNTISRSSCHAGFKGLWEKETGYLSSDLLAQIDADFSTIYQTKLKGNVQSVGTVAGNLCTEFVELLGLHDDVAVSVSLIDAHAAVPGARIDEAGVLQIVMGTSTCHLLLSDTQRMIPGVAGVVKDGILPGLYAYEAGQAAVGDLFASFITEQLPAKYSEQAKENGQDIFTYLNTLAQKEAAIEHGLVILDWHHGNRSPYMNQQLTGVVIGEKLSTTAIDRYRALVESTAFGTRQILELFVDNDVAIHKIVCTGGIPIKNDYLMQVYADVLQYDLHVISVPEIPAVGAARLAMQARNQSAVMEDESLTSRIFKPQNNKYEKQYTMYKTLGKTLHNSEVMQLLADFQSEGE